MYFSDYTMKQKAIWLAVWTVSLTVGYGITYLVLWLLGLCSYDWLCSIVACIVASFASNRLESFFEDNERRKREKEYGKLFDDAGI